MAYFAHSRNLLGQRHLLTEHLEAVAERSASFSMKFGAAELGRWVGTWHDVGKFHPEFQQYLQDAEQSPKGKQRGPDHKAAGSSIALQYGDFLAPLIAGHHGGLKDIHTDLRPWLTQRLGELRVAESVAIAEQIVHSLYPHAQLSPPQWIQDPVSEEFFLRMLFSSLVDADFLDTEAHFNPERVGQRDVVISLSSLFEILLADQARLSGQRHDPVNDVRHAVYLDCLDAGTADRGFFRLTVPTGGGKTRSMVSFALKHALAHGLDRVIVAIPFTSITDQTAVEYRSIFQSERAVLEHHSAIESHESEEGLLDSAWRRLAAQNWDAPITVTTTVQLFESLLGHTPTACRKLHNITRSVIILDEVQMLPVTLLDPILDVLRELVDHYQVSVVLSTATQPALDESPSFRGLPNIREIVRDPSQHFDRLKRVEYDVVARSEGAWDWDRVALEMRTSRQSLVIVNTKADALAILDALDDPSALHLSTLLCGAHRRDVLREVRHRLQAAQPCQLVATQVVEAGIDLDFPLVLRALGPLDRIVQAAGRCNREGRLEIGRVVVFQPSEGGMPPGPYATATQLTEAMVRDASFDFHDPTTYRTYFRDFYARAPLDKPGVQSLRQRYAFAQVASAFRMIEDRTVTVAVKYRGRNQPLDDIDRILADLRHSRGNPREHWRALQPFLVNVRERQMAAFTHDGLAVEVVPGLWEWLGEYHAVRGLAAGRLEPESLVI